MIAAPAQVLLRPAVDGDARVLADIFLAARRHSLSFLAVVHTDDEVRDWSARTLVPRGTVVVAELAGRIAGFADIGDGWLHHLWVDPPAQGKGVGLALFRRAQVRAPAGFLLWVFERNEQARRFYDHRGCVEVLRTDGADNEEHEPDVQLRWTPGSTLG